MTIEISDKAWQLVIGLDLKTSEPVTLKAFASHNRELKDRKKLTLEQRVRIAHDRIAEDDWNDLVVCEEIINKQAALAALIAQTDLGAAILEVEEMTMDDYLNAI